MAKTLAMVFGIVFVLVGLMGFIDTGLVGESGMFQTNTLHDLVHLLFGIILLVVGMKSQASAASAMKIIGIVYLLLAILGFLMIPSGGELLGLVTMNSADHVLHVLLGVVLVAAGMLSKKGGAGGGMPMASSSSM
jgi:hypothetical protein